MHAEDKKTANQTVLAQQLTRAMDGIKQGPSRSTVFIIVGLGAALLIGTLFRYFYLSSQAATSERWVKFDEALFPEQIEALSEDAEFRESPQGRLLQFKQARNKLTQGLSSLASRPEEAVKWLEAATKQYETLAGSAGRIPLLHQEALWGAAKGNEALGVFGEARNYYEQLTKKYPDSALGKEAAKQLTRLDEDKTDAAELAKMLLPK